MINPTQYQLDETYREERIQKAQRQNQYQAQHTHTQPAVERIRRQFSNALTTTGRKLQARYNEQGRSVTETGTFYGVDAV